MQGSPHRRAAVASLDVDLLIRLGEILAVFVAAVATDRFFTRALRSSRHRRFITTAVERQALALARFVLYGFATAVSLSILELPIGSLLASLGVVAIITAFLANQLLGNLIAGIVLLVERPFAIGDQLDINGLPSNAQAPFIVEAVGLRTTLLRTKDGLAVVIPNIWFLGNPFVNRTEFLASPEETPTAQ